jgi:DNA-binding MarR family transcriptional regulator
MAKKKDTLIEEAEKIKADLAELKKKKKVLDSKPAKKTTKKAEAKPAKKTTKKAEAKPVKVKKLTKKELEEAKRIEELTLEEELEEQLSDEEIENFQIEKVDMERLTNKVCDILAEKESDGMFQGELWKKLKLTNQIGSRLALKLERMGTITREKLLENNRWTYKLILKKTPISTQSIENAPCLVCPVEQKCSLDGEISPRNCQFIEDWVIAELKKPVKAK